MTLADPFSTITAWLGSGAVWLRLHWIEIAIALMAGTLIFLALSWIKRRARGRLAATSHPESYGAIATRAVARTSRFFRIMVSAELVASVANPPAGLRTLLHALFTVSVVIQVAIWAREIVLGIIERRARADAEGHETLATAMTLIRVLVTFIIFAIAAIVVLDNLGVNVTGLIAGLGVGGIAIGLAAQGIFADLFAALSIIFDKPFRRGDMIGYADGRTARVEKIGLKTTRLRSVDGQAIIIGNAQLLDRDLQNITQRPHRRIKFLLQLVCQTPAAVCAALPGRLQALVEAEGLIFARARFVNFGASSLDFELEFDSGPSFDDMDDARHRIGLAILAMTNAEGIEFAYPTQTTFTAAPNGRMVMPYAEVQPVHNVDPTDSQAERR